MLLQSFLDLPLNEGDREELLIADNFEWSAYEQLLLKLENNTFYKVSYLDGLLCIMAPSEKHESISENIGSLITLYFQLKDIDYWQMGSTTLKNFQKLAGKEPDKSYCLYYKKSIPDLAIEVLFTSGNIKVLEIYQRLGVPEVWFWQNQKISIYSLINEQYQKQDNSTLLPDLDISAIEKLCAIDNANLAAKEFKKLYEKY